MPHGIWARAPYLHNGSVPTLGHMLCAQVRPARFLRGVLYYDQAMGGFEWAMGDVDADLTPNLDKVTPKANQLTR